MSIKKKKKIVKEQLDELGKKSCELKNARRDQIIYGNRNIYEIFSNSGEEKEIASYNSEGRIGTRWMIWRKLNRAFYNFSL